MNRSITTRWALGLLIAGSLTAGSLAACGRNAGGDQGGTAMNQEQDTGTNAPRTVSVPAGTDLTASLGQPLSTDSNHTGDTFRATLTEPVTVASGTVLPAGATVTGKLTEVRNGGEKGGAKLTLEADRISYPAGITHDVETTPVELVAKGSSTEKSLEKVAAGAVGGGVIGGVIGGKKGAAIGAAVGAGAGTVVAIATNQDDQIELPAGQKLRFALTRPVELPLTAENTR